MKTQKYIQITVNNMFSLTNEKNVMLAFLLRVKLNWNPLQVGRYLKLSVNQVNQLNTARLYMLSSAKYEHVIFTAKHNVCEQACFMYTRKVFTDSINSQNQITQERLENRIKEFQS